MTLTTYDENLCRIIEPNVSTTRERFEALKIFRDCGIPVIVWMTPVLPYINDTKENLNGILEYCIEAKVYGIIFFGFGLTLRAVYERIYGNAYQIDSPKDKALRSIFYQTCKEHGIETDTNRLFAYLREYENNSYEQMTIDNYLF